MKGLKIFRDRQEYRTQTALAEVLGIKPSNVSEWEAGNGYPSYEIIKKLLELGATVEELFGVEYKMAAVDPVELANFSDAEAGALVRQGLRFLYGGLR